MLASSRLAVVAARRSFSTGAETTIQLNAGAFNSFECNGPTMTETTVSNDDMIKWYKDMFTIRRMEIASDTMYKQREIRGFCHLYDGQEAVAVGMEAACTLEDHFVTAYRDHAHQYCRGDTVKSIMAELTGKFAGCSKGKGGSMHMYKEDANFYGGNGIVGAQIPIGAGLALAIKYKKTPDAMAVAMHGKGDDGETAGNGGRERARRSKRGRIDGMATAVPFLGSRRGRMSSHRSTSTTAWCPSGNRSRSTGSG